MLKDGLPINTTALLEQAPQLETARANLLQTCAYFELEKNNVFQRSGHTQNDVISFSLQLLKSMEISPEFTNIHVRNIIFLSTADQLLSLVEQGDITSPEGRAQLTMLKLISSGLDRDRHYGTFSERIRRKSSFHQPTARMFNPDFLEESDMYRKSNGIVEFAQERKREITPEFQMTIDEAIETIAKKLDMTPEQIQEKRQKLHVLFINASSEEMGNIGMSRELETSMTGDAYSITDEDGHAYIIINTEDKNILEHEVAHALSEFPGFGHHGLLMKGLFEAITEDLTTRPNAYKALLDVLNIYIYTNLYQDHAQGRQNVRGMYRGDPDAVQRLFTDILATHGFEGFSLLLRMGHQWDEASPLFALEPEEVRRRFEKMQGGIYRKNVYIDGSRKTEKWVFVKDKQD